MPQPLSKTEYAFIDISDEGELFKYAKKLEGHTFREVLDLDIAPDGVNREYGSKRYKGGMGNLIEERYFGYKANSDERPDFPDAGVELKTTCLDVKKDGTDSAGERLVLTMIPFDREVADDLEDTHLWQKMERILLIYYKRDKSVDAYDQEIEYVTLFTPPAADMPIIRDDYYYIRDLLKAGKAEELSESQTKYLGACTKGASEAKMWTEQYYPPHAKAKRRAFCFKRQYMDYVLNHYIEGDEADAESIVKDPADLEGMSFEEYVLSLVEPYIGQTDWEICSELGVPYTRNKAQWSSITYHMLGLGSDRAEEFEKAGINARTVRIEKRGKIKESLSLNTFKFEDLAREENFEESDLYRYFDETRFFFVAFDANEEGNYRLRGARFWSMPRKDLDGPLRLCWERTRDLARDGITFRKKFDKNGKLVIVNNLPKQSDGLVGHVRPHASHAAYMLKDGTRIGNIERDGDRLPDGQWMTRQSFWLNSDYVYGIVESV